MEITQQESKSAAVTRKQAAKQAEETAPRWGWVEPAVWSKRMLTALEQGVRGGKWFSLIDKVYRKPNLEAAYRRVAKNRGGPGVDHVTVEAYGQRLEPEVEKLQRELKQGTYKPQAIRRKWIDKPGTNKKRPLGIPTVRDRVVQGAVRQVLEPIFEKEFAECSYGFRPGRSCKDALREVNARLKEGFQWVVDMDLADFFGSLSHERLMRRVKEKVSDGRVLDLIEQFLSQRVMENMKEWEPEEGTPQGGVISPLLANIYLNSLDHLVTEQGYILIRYADDLLVMCPSQEAAHRVMDLVKPWIEDNGLRLNEEKTRTVDMRQPNAWFEFLGYRFKRTVRKDRIIALPRPKSRAKLRDKIRKHTKRCNGKSLPEIIQKLNPILRGWFGYFKHSHHTALSDEDKWVRMRLRSILRKRQRRKGQGRGKDHFRWPNAFFAERGLFSLAAAHESACQSVRR